MDSSVSKSRGGGGGNHSGNSRPSSRGGGRGGRGGGKGKKRDMGRNAWSKQKGDKRSANDNYQASKRQKLENGDEEAVLPVYATKFSEEDLKAEERRPKKKVAVMIGYSGTGYKGMQMAPDQKTIEGDLFKAFVAAGAISKANADDPKKSSFVRCARTDKGVHAAGNVISLKLIVEDEDIVQKINDNLTHQIRVWGIERTNNGFSSYQMVDSRIYEYLIPAHSFLPPHPSSFLGRKCAEWAELEGDIEAWKKRQEEVEGYWAKVDAEVIKPMLEEYDEDIREVLEKALYLDMGDGKTKPDDDNENEEVEMKAVPETDDSKLAEVAAAPASTETEPLPEKTSEENQVSQPTQANPADPAAESRKQRAITIDKATKRLRQAYLTSRRTYRIPDQRLQRLREILNLYTGTHNFHNYTIQKTHSDPSANRVIKSFIVDDKPILINGTQWISLKVHGQSFMMHQIRKMVGMAALIIRCGTSPSLIKSSYTDINISIPKAPSLGLLLERPVFDSYNKRATSMMGHNAIDFDKYHDELQSFKQKEIYERMYIDEERDNHFGNFFNHVDNYPASTFLFVTSGGVKATREDGSAGVFTGAAGGEKKEGQEETDGDDGKADSDGEDGEDGAGNEG